MQAEQVVYVVIWQSCTEQVAGFQLINAAASEEGNVKGGYPEAKVEMQSQSGV